ncbi:MAG: 30S ribosomal protein S11 [Candidatus Liptonbacteria bacterium]|nr:30S ribosomal protein S11 [Candidatus Liptonbacteria bacterium]
MGKTKVNTQAPEEAGKPKVVNAAAETPKDAVVPAKLEKKAKGLERGRVYINASYNNTTVTVTDGAGNVVAWASAGALGFAGPKKATPFASSKVIAAIGEKLKSAWPASLEVIVKGVGSGRDSAVRSLINHGCNIVSIKDVTPVPHNGPRPPKIRRV